MIFKHFNRQKRNFFHVIDFIRINVQIIHKLSVNLLVLILISKSFQTFFLEISFGLYVENILHVY